MTTTRHSMLSSIINQRSFMKPIRIPSHAAAFMSAIAVLLQISPALNASPQGGIAMTQGSRVPGMPVASTDKARPNDRGPVEVTFTKWLTGLAEVINGFGDAEKHGLMIGVTGGDIPGTFVGEVFRNPKSGNPALTKGINGLGAVYEVHNENGDHVFTALIRGGTDRSTGAALLDGVVLAGWRTGAAVHVEFQTRPAIPRTTSCDGAPINKTCFEGTIRVGRAPRD